MQRRRALFELDLEIHKLEMVHGRRPYRYRRCNVCMRLHVADATGCDGRGKHLFELWLSISPDLIYVESDQ